MYGFFFHSSILASDIFFVCLQERLRTIYQLSDDELSEQYDKIKLRGTYFVQAFDSQVRIQRIHC